MRIKLIKPEHITYCRWCKARGYKERAIWHLTGANEQSCDKHVGELRSIATKEAAIARKELSEADYQTWMRL